MKDLQTARHLCIFYNCISLSYRWSGCYINSHHHTHSHFPLGFCVCVPSVQEGHRARRRFNWHGRVPNDGWMAGWRETVSQSLSLTGSVPESMTAICHFHRLFSALCVCPHLCRRTVTRVLALMCLCIQAATVCKC